MSPDIAGSALQPIRMCRSVWLLQLAPVCFLMPAHISHLPSACPRLAPVDQYTTRQMKAEYKKDGNVARLPSFHAFHYHGGFTEEISTQRDDVAYELYRQFWFNASRTDLCKPFLKLPPYQCTMDTEVAAYTPLGAIAAAYANMALFVGVLTTVSKQCQKQLDKRGLDINAKLRCGAGFLMQSVLVHADSEEAVGGERLQDHDAVAGVVSDIALERLALAGMGWRDGLLETDDVATSRQLLVCFPDSGTGRAGVWSRAVCVAQGLEKGTMLPYLRAARQRGWAVVSFDPKRSAAEQDAGAGATPCLAHWAALLRRSAAAQAGGAIYVVAHSHGGACFADCLAATSMDVARGRLRAVALTDSVHLAERLDAPRRALLAERGCHWRRSRAPMDEVLDSSSRWPMAAGWPPGSPPPAGGVRVVSAATADHVSTSWTSLGSIFRTFDAA